MIQYKKYKLEKLNTGDERYYYFLNGKLIIPKAVPPYRQHPLGFISLTVFPIILLLLFCEPKNETYLVMLIMVFCPGFITGGFFSILTYLSYYKDMKAWKEKVKKDYTENKLRIKYTENSIVENKGIRG